MARRQQEVRCSFCNKSQDEVRKIIAGAAAFICDECVEVCNEVLADDPGMSESSDGQDGPATNPAEAQSASGHSVRCAVCSMPAAVEDALLIPDRGALCARCIKEIEAAAVRSLESDN